MQDTIFDLSHTLTLQGCDTQLLLSKELYHPASYPKDQIAAYKKAKEEVCDQLNISSHGSLKICPNQESVYDALFHAIYSKKMLDEGKCDVIIPDLHSKYFSLAVSKFTNLGLEFSPISSEKSGLIHVNDLELYLGSSVACVILPVALATTHHLQPVEDWIQLCKSYNIHLHLCIDSALDAFYFQSLNVTPDSFSLCLDTQKGRDVNVLVQPTQKNLPFIENALFDSALVENVLTVSEVLRQLNHLEEKVMKMSYSVHLFGQQLKKKEPHVEILLQHDKRHPMSLIVDFPGIHYERMLHALARHGVLAGISGGLDPSLHYVLKHIHKPSFSALQFYFNEKMQPGVIDEIVSRIASACKLNAPFQCQLEEV